ncbi:MAG TPA: cytochrome c maturation protein CcmE [Chitinophagaceae bacterium]|nr:cytochrome c maturation protein CcmE [Chitinophagaceae bacterium]
MKKTHIALLVLVAAAVCVIVSMFGDMSTYETFGTAAENPNKQFHVIGVLEGDRKVDYDPETDPNHCSFLVRDKAGNVKKVIFNGAKPTDIEKSEQIVMKGKMDGDAFRCTQIQMKCPSKYKNDQIAVGNAS